MHYILAPGAIEQLANLRRSYEAEKHVDLATKPSLFGVPTMFGGTDVVARGKQISFLEKINAILSPYLIKDEEIKTLPQWQAKLMASRILIATCLYIQSEIANSKEKSALYRLINQVLGINSVNYLDEEDKDSFFSTAYKLTHQDKVTHSLNALLRELGKKEFTKEEWELFSTFISKEVDKKLIPKTPPNNFPVTSFIQPIFRSSFTFVGATIGGAIADVISSSSATVTPRLHLSSWIGSVMLVAGAPGGAAGIALIAPNIASRIISSFCNTSFAGISGATMGFVGKGAGAIVGVPFDLAYNLIWSMGSLISNYSSSETTFAPIDGIRLADGVLMAKGNPIQFSTSKPIAGQRCLLEITDSGDFKFDGKEVTEPNIAVIDALHALNSSGATGLRTEL